MFDDLVETSQLGHPICGMVNRPNFALNPVDAETGVMPALRITMPHIASLRESEETIKEIASCDDAELRVTYLRKTIMPAKSA